MKKSQLSYAIWPWGTATREQAELAAKEITEIGYKSFESVKAAIYAYDMNVEEYKAMLDKYGLTADSFYFHLPPCGQEEKLFDTLEKELDFVAKLGVTRATLQGTGGRPEVADEPSKEASLKTMVRFAEIAKTFGIATNVHPHVNTYFMYEDEIDYVMKNSDSNLIYFAPDTAHITAAGADAVEVIRRYADRVNFTHLKDYTLGDEITTDGWVDTDVPIMDCFHGIGEGAIDFPEILKILDSVNYTGPLCIELDKAPISNADSAKKSYDYLVKFLED